MNWLVQCDLRKRSRVQSEGGTDSTSDCAEGDLVCVGHGLPMERRAPRTGRLWCNRSHAVAGVGAGRNVIDYRVTELAPCSWGM